MKKSQIFQKRITHAREEHKEEVISEEALRVDYILSLVQCGVDGVQIWPEFPYEAQPNQNTDIFIDKENGFFVEIKFFRQIPSRWNPPYTQHYGSLLADVYKLKLFTKNSRRRLLIIIADSQFYTYFGNKGLLPRGNISSWKVILVQNILPKTALGELQKRQWNKAT